MTRDNAFDRDSGYSGQDYDSDRERAEGDKAPAGSVAARPADAARSGADPDLPPDAGQRAWFDPATGEVHGGGIGAGGGSPGEDYDSDPATGDGFPQTGKGSR